MKPDYKIPKEVAEVGEKLIGAGYEAYLVGGCVRDLFLEKEPKDWDITTNAKPEDILKLFPDSFYENNFGTVGVKIKKSKSKNQNDGSKLKNGGIKNGEETEIVEVTTFRVEGKYTDKRHPDEIRFAKTVEEDLSRRDFTINALALGMTPGKKHLTTDKEDKKNRMLNINGQRLIDPFAGQSDLKNKIIRAVGKPEERFNEDALRLARAVRLAIELGFAIEDETFRAIKKKAPELPIIAKERIRDELAKIIMAEQAAKGIELLEDVGLLAHIMPELREGIGTDQAKHHIYTVWEHNVRSLDYAAKENYSLEVRLASLLHDVGKPRTKQGEGENATFHGHEVAGARLTQKMLERLRFPKETIEYITHLVRYHLFYYNVGEVSESGVRRFLRRVGPENIDDLIKVRKADRIGSGVPKAIPYKLRHLLFMIEKVKHDPLSPKMLKVDGEDVMKILGIVPGPKVGQILIVLLEEVLDDPSKNDEKHLEARIKDLGNLPEEELVKIAKAAKGKKDEFEAGEEEEMKKKYYVK